MSNYMGAQAKSTNRTKYDLGRVHGVISVIMRLCTFYVTITRNEDKLCYFFIFPKYLLQGFQRELRCLGICTCAKTLTAYETY